MSLHKTLVKSIEAASTAYTVWLDAEMGNGDADKKLKRYRAAVKAYAEAYEEHRRKNS